MHDKSIRARLPQEGQAHKKGCTLEGRGVQPWRRRKRGLSRSGCGSLPQSYSQQLSRSHFGQIRDSQRDILYRSTLREELIKSPEQYAARRPPAGGTARGNQPRFVSGRSLFITHAVLMTADA